MHLKIHITYDKMATLSHKNPDFFLNSQQNFEDIGNNNSLRKVLNKYDYSQMLEMKNVLIKRKIVQLNI